MGSSSRLARRACGPCFSLCVVLGVLVRAVLRVLAARPDCSPPELVLEEAATGGVGASAVRHLVREVTEYRRTRSGVRVNNGSVFTWAAHARRHGCQAVVQQLFEEVPCEISGVAIFQVGLGAVHQVRKVEPPACLPNLLNGLASLHGVNVVDHCLNALHSICDLGQMSRLAAGSSFKVRHFERQAFGNIRDRRA